MEHHRPSFSGSDHLQAGDFILTSAVDLSGTPAGIASSAPSSPISLSPREGSISRRRLSWGRMERQHVDMLDDPLRLDTSTTQVRDDHEGPDTDTPHEDDALSRGGFFRVPANASESSLIATYRSKSVTSEYNDIDLDDDEARLTSLTAGSRSSEASNVDLERTPGSMSRSNRSKSVRYSSAPSTGERLRSVKRNLRRVSMRVVNFAGAGLEEKLRGVRLPDDEDEDKRTRGKERAQEGTVDYEAVEDEEELPDLAARLPTRGRTLGFFDSTSRIRLTMFRFLANSWTEPTVLLLIVFNAIVLTIQSARSLILPNDNALPPPVRGYFHTWEDYALFILFILFTLEAFARIVTTGFILDPDVPTSALYKGLFSYSPAPAVSRDAQPGFSLSMSQSSSFASSLSRSASQRSGAPTLNSIINQFRENISRPFALAHHRTQSGSVPLSTSTSHEPAVLGGRGRQYSTGLLQEKGLNGTASSSSPSDIFSGSDYIPPPHHVHDPRDVSKPTFFARAMRSAAAEGPDDRTGAGGKSGKEYLGLPFRLTVYTAQDHVTRNVPYLRHSWNRIDFIAIIAFWITFILAEVGVEHSPTRHIGLFRALSVLRTSRLLAVTSGTTTIMRSLKRARPLLTNVAYFVLFAIILFSIIGIQSFKGSYRRSCFFQTDSGDDIQLDQRCGGYIDPGSLNVTGYQTLDGSTSKSSKGFICPLGQICKELDNPYEGIQNFDTIYFAALEVVIVASANGWSPMMYNMIDAEFFVSCFFFIVCLIVLNFWLINLFVAVITNTFSAIRKDTQKSAFGAAPLGPIALDNDDEYGMLDGRTRSGSSTIKEWYDRTKWVWVLFALASVVLQATRSTQSSDEHLRILEWGELALTFLFDIDIAWRFLGFLPRWRNFFDHGNNWLDLLLAVGSTIIQTPVIRDSTVYPWLTAFQLMRFYRVILEVPRMRPLLLTVFGNLYGMVNMTLFLILSNYIAALVGVQLLRGDMDGDVNMNFREIYNSFLAMYQVFSSENWTDVLFQSSVAGVPLSQSVVIAFFITIWFLFANFILLQLFIAVINENFDVAEESKRGKQATNYYAMQQPVQASPAWLRRLNPYRWFRANPKSIAVENLPSNLILPMQKAVIQDSTFNPDSSTASMRRGKSLIKGHYSSKSISALQRLFSGDSRSNDVPLATLRAPRRDSVAPQDPNHEELERHLEILASINADVQEAQDINDALYERRAQKADFIRSHPSYDKTFWIFSQKNRLRQFCQRLVEPANGDRIFGVPHSPVAHSIFQLILLLAVIGGIVVEGIATPIYRKNFYTEHGQVIAWFDSAEAAFGFLLFIEFLIKLVADGFVFTPNAYVRSIWNVLDLAILVGLIVNVTTGLIVVGGLSRFTRSLKALRALRLITLIEKMRSTFQSLIISGAVRILDAAMLAILYMIPFAVWGLNIFHGLLNECNDSNAAGLGDCVNEFANSVIGDDGAYSFLAPRAWNNPAPSTVFSFDNFRSSLLILFEIVSLEGWVDAMNVATSAAGEGLQPQTNNAEANSLFFLIYMQLGAVVVLTLFVSIIIGNFSSKAGFALLTREQREWVDLQKLIKRQRPSKRPKTRPTSRFRAWCYDRAVHKHGWWSRMMTFLFIIHILALMSQTLSTQDEVDELRNSWFLAITLIYVVDIIIRWFGLGFRSFKANGWNIFDVIVAVGALVTTVIDRLGSESFLLAQLQKLFLVSIAFKLVQRTNSLNQLFKTAMASLPVILSLLALWFILFLFFGILFVEVFGLTKWGSAETRTQNYSSLGSALVMLAFMSTGEGWNQYMHDYALVYPQCTPASDEFPLTDCGSIGWAFTLFIAWNILSMYIFVNMFTGVVVESFSYVFQLVGGTKAITREEMRAFKKVWAEFANPRTGYLEKGQLVPFLGKLSGVFEVRIYPAEYNVKNLLALSQTDKEDEHSWTGSHVIVDGVDFVKLNRILSGLDNSKIRKRRTLYARMYNEAMISQEPGKGISFTNMLLMLAHHKLIDDRESLSLKELVTRTEINKFVNDLVNLDRVRSLLKTIYYRRQFRAIMEEKRRQQMFDQDIPAIIVEDMPSTPPISSRDITLANRDSMGFFHDPSSPSSTSPSPSPYHSPDISVALDSPLRRSRGLQRNRRVSDISMLSADLGYQYPVESSPSRDSHEEEDPQHVLSSLQNSMWGEMMLEAAGDHEATR